LRHPVWITLAAMACAACSHRVDPRVPKGYPSSYGDEIDAAEREGKLDILSATDQRKAAGLIAEFRRRYPKIRLNFVEMPAQQVDETFRRQVQEGHGTADLVWSAAMDLQMKLVNDGLTQ
jgi:iron(III) transport system substrate-binding protein